MNPPSFKEFIRRLRSVAADQVNEKPILFVEFKNNEGYGFQSRIELYDFPKEDVVTYRYVDREPTKIREWPLRTNDYVILNIIPPRRSRVDSKRTTLCIIQLGVRLND